MNVVVIEDESPSARQLIERLAAVAPRARVVAQLASVESVVHWLAAHDPPDLIFADIELRDGRVFEAFRRVHARSPVIFTTAYDRFVLDAFRAQGIAYLLKPYGEPELAAALAKYEDLRRSFAQLETSRLDRLLEQLTAEPRDQLRHFTVKARQRIQVLALERVALIWLGPTGVEIIDKQGRSHFPARDTSLLEIERSLPPAAFFRLNRSELVALDAIDHVDSVDDRLVVTTKGGGRACTVSVHRTASFRKWIGMS